MIKSIKITNFCSIGETQEISFEILNKEVLDDSVAAVAGHNINLVNCFIGHNASGKTTVLKALVFLFWLMSDSYTSMKTDGLIPVDAHKLFDNELTKFEIEFFNQDRLFQYKVALNKRQIQSEFLGEKLKRGYTRIFEYTRTEDNWEFIQAPKITINKTDLSRFKERKNVSVFASLLDTGYLPNLAFIKRFGSNVTRSGHFSLPPVVAYLGISKSFYTNQELQKEALNFVKDIDLGISGFEFFKENLKDDETADDAEKSPFLECLHEKGKGLGFKLPLTDESNGTRHSLQLLAKVSPMLKTGGVVILDEIESGLHPYVAKKIISLFESKMTNPLNAQLIFSTHQHLLLNDRTKTQIFLVEKDSKSFETEVYRLDDVEGVRNDENFFNKYLAGAYGGIPNIKWVNS